MGKSIEKFLLTHLLPLVTHGPDSVLCSHVRAEISSSYTLPAVLEQYLGCPVLGMFLEQLMHGEGRCLWKQDLNSVVIKLFIDIL